MSAEYETNGQRQPTLLDLGKPSPNAIFSAIIPHSPDEAAIFGAFASLVSLMTLRRPRR
jgi:hypothetical protein